MRPRFTTLAHPYQYEQKILSTANIQKKPSYYASLGLPNLSAQKYHSVHYLEMIFSANKNLQIVNNLFCPWIYFANKTCQVCQLTCDVCQQNEPGYYSSPGSRIRFLITAKI